MFKFFYILKNAINKYAIFITIILSILTLYLSLFDFFSEFNCCKSKIGQGFAILLKECNPCPDINHYSKPIWYLFFITYTFSIILYFGFNFLKIKHFFDRYLFSETILTMCLAITSFTSFSYTQFYDFYIMLILIFIVLFGLCNLINNFSYYNKVYKKVIYLICFCIYQNILFWSFAFFGLYRCVGGCL